MQEARPGMIFFQGAFRPFFLGAGLWAGIALLVWLLVLGGRIDLPIAFGPDLLAVSGAAWIAAFGLFSWRYGRMCLTAPA